MGSETEPSYGIARADFSLFVCLMCNNGPAEIPGKVLHLHTDAKQPLLRAATTLRGNKAAGDQEEGAMPRCLTPGAGEAGELWAELGAILPPQGVLGPTGQDAS